MNSYPRELHVDFSKLRTNTLRRYAWYYKLSANADVRPELASSCAKHFMVHLDVDEGQVLANFEAYIINPNSVKRSGGALNGVSHASSAPGGKRPLSATTTTNSSSSSSSSSAASTADEPPAKKKRHVQIPEGRLVAAKVKDNYILARITKYVKRKKAYRVEDADEMARERVSFELSQDQLIVLPTEEELVSRKALPKGARVLARFPKTSTFYPATIAKRADKNKYGVRFDDDEKGPDGNIRVVKVNATEVAIESF